MSVQPKMALGIEKLLHCWQVLTLYSLVIAFFNGYVSH